MLPIWWNKDEYIIGWKVSTTVLEHLHKSGLICGRQILPGPDMARYEKNGRISAGAGATLNFWC